MRTTWVRFWAAATKDAKAATSAEALPPGQALEAASPDSRKPSPAKRILTGCAAGALGFAAAGAAAGAAVGIAAAGGGAALRLEGASLTLRRVALVSSKNFAMASSDAASTTIGDMPGQAVAPTRSKAFVTPSPCFRIASQHCLSSPPQAATKIGANKNSLSPSDLASTSKFMFRTILRPGAQMPSKPASTIVRITDCDGNFRKMSTAFLSVSVCSVFTGMPTSFIFAVRASQTS
mmetsp:Transcript_491/g.1019  ORF Transcript_491/g.1019 Transcript_491/m.1019 type:complete len:235 (-) Transcript_491:657-1361(-)